MREYDREKAAEYRKRHPERTREAQRRSHAKTKREAMEAYGGVCACCGETEPDFLSIDHMNNDGAEHRRQLGGRNYGGTNMYRWLRQNDYPEGFQVLCYNCNLAKGFAGSCPHSR